MHSFAERNRRQFDRFIALVAAAESSNEFRPHVSIRPDFGFGASTFTLGISAIVLWGPGGIKVQVPNIPLIACVSGVALCIWGVILMRSTVTLSNGSISLRGLFQGPTLPARDTERVDPVFGRWGLTHVRLSFANGEKVVLPIINRNTAWLVAQVRLETAASGRNVSMSLPSNSKQLT